MDLSLSTYKLYIFVSLDNQFRVSLVTLFLEFLVGKLKLAKDDYLPFFLIMLLLFLHEKIMAKIINGIN